MGLNANFQFKPIVKEEESTKVDESNRTYSNYWLESFTLNVGTTMTMEEPDNTFNIFTIILSKAGGNNGVTFNISDGSTRILILLNANESKVINFHSVPARLISSIQISHDSAGNETISYNMVGFWDNPVKYLL